jgi:hypothetical protein
VQDQVAQQLAKQLDVQPQQVALTTPFFTVTSDVAVAGYPTGYLQDVQQGLLLYLDVPEQGGGWLAGRLVLVLVRVRVLLPGFSVLYRCGPASLQLHCD